MKLNRNLLLVLAVVCAVTFVSAGCDTIKGMYGGSKDVMLTLASKPELSTFCDAVKKARLDDTLRGPGEYTVFAPTDTAFQSLTPKEREDLMDPAQQEKLANIVKFHIVQGKNSEKELKKMTSLKTLNGNMLTFAPEGGKLKVGKAMVITKDIKCKNGTIHIIDAVLMP
jgi:uncharacterized surface protein with fasciclin (FAS1) repeats